MFKKACSFFLLCCIFCTSCKSQSDKEVISVDGKHMVANVLGKDVQLIDVRTSREYNAGHIEGAINYNVMDKERFMEQISALNKNEPVYLYCKAGVRSKNAAELLKEEGFVKIFDYSGGYADWKKSKN